MANVTRFYNPVSIATVATPNINTTAVKTANTTAINNLLASLSNTGQAAYVPAGNWFYNGYLNIKGCTLFGEGRNSRLLGDDGTSMPACTVCLSGSSPALIAVSVELAGKITRGGSQAVRMGFVGTTAAATAGYLVDGVYASAPASIGIQNVGASYGRILNCTVQNCGADGIGHYNGANNCEVGNCSVSSVSDDMFSVVSNGGLTVSNIVYHDCTGYSQITAGSGMKVAGGSNITFRNISVTNMNQNGIAIIAQLSNAAVNTVLVDSCAINTTGLAGYPYTFGGWGCSIFGTDASHAVSNVTILNTTAKNFPTSGSNTGFLTVGAFTSSINTAGFTQG